MSAVALVPFAALAEVAGAALFASTTGAAVLPAGAVPGATFGVSSPMPVSLVAPVLAAGVDGELVEGDGVAASGAVPVAGAASERGTGSLLVESAVPFSMLTALLPPAGAPKAVMFAALISAGASVG